MGVRISNFLLPSLQTKGFPTVAGGPTPMDPISPRPRELPASAQPVSSSSPRANAQRFEELAKQCDDDQELDGYEACLREAFNYWLRCPSSDEDRRDGLERVLTKLGLHHRTNGTAKDSLRFFEKRCAVEEEELKRHGGLGNPEALIHLSEALCAVGNAEEAVDVSKRAIDLLFRKYAGRNDLGLATPRDELLHFGAAWMSLAAAEEVLFSRKQREGVASENDMIVEALQILVHFRRGVKCSKELIGRDDPVTVQLERRYNTSKKSLGKLTANATREQMPPADAAYPGDKSVAAIVAAHETKSDGCIPTSQITISINNNNNMALKPAAPALSAPARQTMSHPQQSLSVPISKTAKDATPRSRSHSVTREATGGKESSSFVAFGSGSSPRLAIAAEPASLSAQCSPRLAPNGKSPFSHVAPPQRRPSIGKVLDPISGSSPPQRKPSIDRAAAVDLLPSLFEKKQPKLAPIVLTCAFKKGLQLLFLVAEKKKRRFLALRSVYWFTRDLHTSFPHYTLTGDTHLLENTKTLENRLDAMEVGPSKIEAAAAQKVRQHRTIDEIKRKKMEQEQVVLFRDMDKKTQNRARRFRLMQAAASSMLLNIDRYVMRRAFIKWFEYLKPRRSTRPLRRAAAHLFKQIDRQLLRRRFITWLRWLKERKRSVFGRRKSAVEREAIQKTLQLIKEQEEENVYQLERDRKRKEEEEFLAKQEEIIRKHSVQFMTAKIGESDDDVPSPEPEPPISVTIMQFLDVHVGDLLNALHEVSEEPDESARIEKGDGEKVRFVEAAQKYATSPDFKRQVDLLPYPEEDKSYNTQVVLPLMVTLVEDHTFHSEQNLATIRFILKIFHPWVNFSSIYFDGDVLLAAVASGDCEYVEALLDGIPGWTLDNGNHACELVSKCACHVTKAVPLMEVLLLKCEGVVAFHAFKDRMGPLLLQFFDRWVPSTIRSVAQRRGSLYDVQSESSLRARISTLFERMLLDVHSFDFPHTLELPDKQTLMSRMCMGGELELVTLYCSLIDEGTAGMLLSRKQSDGTNCLVQAVRSKNVALVRYLLSDFEEATSGLLHEKYNNNETIIEIARIRMCSEDMILLLRNHGAVDEEGVSEVPSPSRPASQESRMSSLFGDSGTGNNDDADVSGGGKRGGAFFNLDEDDEEDGDDGGGGDDIDRLFDDDDLHSGGDSDLGFASPQPPDAFNSSFKRLVA